MNTNTLFINFWIGFPVWIKLGSKSACQLASQALFGLIFIWVKVKPIELARDKIKENKSICKNARKHVLMYVFRFKRTYIYQYMNLYVHACAYMLC